MSIVNNADRSAGIDLIRVLGIVAVVAGHVWSDDLVRAGIYSWHVPLFFFLTGYLWTPGRSLRSEVRRRARSLLRPYLVWLVLIAAIWLPWSTASGSSPTADLARLVVGGQHLVRPFSAFWFVTALFVCAVVLRAAERYPSPVVWAVAVAGVGAATIAPQVVLLAPLSAGTALGALVFVLAGRAAQSALPQIRRPLFVGSALITSGATALALGVRSLDLKRADFGTPVLSIVVASALCTGAVLVAVALCARIGRRTSSVVTTLAASGIGVVLTHAVVIWALPDSPPAFVFLAATVLPWMVLVALSGTAVAPWMLGTPARPLRSASSARTA